MMPYSSMVPYAFEAHTTLSRSPRQVCSRQHAERSMLFSLCLSRFRVHQEDTLHVPGFLGPENGFCCPGRFHQHGLLVVKALTHHCQPPLEKYTTSSQLYQSGVRTRCAERSWIMVSLPVVTAPTVGVSLCTEQSVDLRSDGDPLWRSHGQRLRVRQVGAQPNFLINTILDNTSPITIDDPVIRLTKNNLGTLARSSYPGFHVGHECRWRRFHGSDSSELAPRRQGEGGERT